MLLLDHISLHFEIVKNKHFSKVYNQHFLSLIDCWSNWPACCNSRYTILFVFPTYSNSSCPLQWKTRMLVVWAQNLLCDLTSVHKCLHAFIYSVSLDWNPWISFTAWLCPPEISVSSPSPRNAHSLVVLCSHVCFIAKVDGRFVLYCYLQAHKKSIILSTDPNNHSDMEYDILTALEKHRQDMNETQGNKEMLKNAKIWT